MLFAGSFTTSMWPQQYCFRSFALLEHRRAPAGESDSLQSAAGAMLSWQSTTALPGLVSPIAVAASVLLYNAVTKNLGEDRVNIDNSPRF
jgi:hypothetical protein